MRFITENKNDVRITFAFSEGFHRCIWKIMIPLILLATVCACVLRLAGVF
jgi:hypothetical protein